jgi:pre-mRNA-processing factor 6
VHPPQESTNACPAPSPSHTTHTFPPALPQNYAPAPDSLLARAVAQTDTAKSIDPSTGLSSALGGTSSVQSDLTAIGGGRSTMLRSQLDRLSDSVTGQSTVDPKGYLTDLTSIKISSDAEISDIKKARLLLKSVIQTNPKHAPGWIAAARLEEVAGKLQVGGLVWRGEGRC